MSETWFASCPKGLEELLADELRELGAETVRQTVAGVYATGPLSFAYRACLWSRLANRILYPQARFEVNSADDLYQGAKAIAWHQHLTPRNSFAIDFIGTNRAIRHSQFGAQRVKDAIVDTLQARYGDRPDVDLRRPDLRINVHLAKNRANISIDMSGDSLHKRGYRQAMVPAPLKENLAAALLIRAGWPQMLANAGEVSAIALLDPLCGSGTLLIEGAMMAADIAPGLQRRKFGFHGWLQHDIDLWQDIRADALARAEAGLERGRRGELPEIRGYDKDTRAVKATEENIAAADLEGIVRVVAKPLEAFKKPTHRSLDNGLLITNPPYGERWGDAEALRPLYQTLGELAKQECPGWTLAVFTGNPDLAQELRLRARKKYQLYNGTIASQLLLFDLRSADEQRDEERDEQRIERQRAERAAALSEGATMFAARLKKNARRLKPWLKQSGVSCYRLYDADMPEYAVAVDIYGDAIHVQEYAPPASIDEQQANKRLSEVKAALQSLYPQSQNKLFFKQRRRQKGSDQYQKSQGRANANAVFNIVEGEASVEVNLADYLDSGLFLDHRPVRKLLADMADGKHVLNLFCYTAVASVQMAQGGATSSLSVDMSNSYLDWAQRNFDLNHLGKNHRLLRADCLDWLAQQAAAGEASYDLIFLDPPTFSNSKKMQSALDIQRDHGQIIDHAMKLLVADGNLVFSNNFRRFKMDQTVLDNFQVENISEQTFDPDFQRNRKIHNCWLIRHKTDAQDNLSQTASGHTPDPWRKKK